MGYRIHLPIIDERLILPAVLTGNFHSPALVEFVIDTGSPDSYLSSADVLRLQIPTKSIKPAGTVPFGGSQFKYILLKNINMHIFKEGKNPKDKIVVPFNLRALKTTKTRQDRVEYSTTLPSILGLDFLKANKFTLYVNMAENISYLQKGTL